LTQGVLESAHKVNSVETRQEFKSSQVYFFQ